MTGLLGGAGAASLLAASIPALAQVPARAKDGMVVIGMSLEPPVLDPNLNAAAAVREITYQNIYESLTRIARDGSIVPGLAESWTVSADGTEYVFKLRAEVKYHDGEPCTADDVKFTLDRLSAPDATAPGKSLYTTIKSVDVVDPTTVKLTLKGPDAFLLYNVGIGDASIMGRKSAATNGVKPVGTGPFMFKERKEGDSVTLFKSPTYRDPASIKLIKLVFKFIKDAAAQLNALKAGDVDTFPGFQSPEQVGQIKADPRFAVVIGSTQGETILATNNGRKPFDDLRVRQAIAHALNRDDLIAGENGFALPIGSHFPPHDRAYVDLTKTYPFDIAKGKKLLADAGHPNGFEATLKLPPVGYAQRSGEIVVSQLGKIGIKLKITQLQWPQWLAEVFKERNYDLTIVAHTEANDLDRYARDGYYWGYDSKAFKDNWAAVIKEADPAKRAELVKKAQKIIADDAVNGFLYQLGKVGVWNKNLVGMWENSPTPSIDMSGVSWKL
ncbi:MAG: ABC transporter substrate-binding protein [Rhodospirillales bacterium]|nr:MAG: ABC transporter substrate-binding protein [Rhodospirillales bacterium]